MDLDKAIRERHSARRFKTKSPNWRDIIKAIDAARLAPTAGNIPTVKFILITDEEKIKKLAQACQQDFLEEVEYVLAVCTDSAQCERSYGERAKKYSAQQAGASIQNFLLKITDLDLATCWIGAFSDDEVKRILQIPENIEIEALFPIGYEMPKKSRQRPKSILDQCLFFNTWKNKYMQAIRKPEAL